MNTKWQVSPEVLSSRIDDEVVLMSIEAGYYFALDTVGSRIWELLSKPLTNDELTEALMEEYDVERDTCVKEVNSFIEEMRSKNLIIRLEN